MEGRSLSQEARDRAVLRPCAGVVRMSRKAELHVVARPLPHGVTEIEEKVVDPILPAAVIDRRKGCIAPYRVARLAVRIDVGNDVPGGRGEERIVRRPGG